MGAFLRIVDPSKAHTKDQRSARPTIATSVTAEPDLSPCALACNQSPHGEDVSLCGTRLQHGRETGHALSRARPGRRQAGTALAFYVRSYRRRLIWPDLSSGTM